MKKFKIALASLGILVMFSCAVKLSDPTAVSATKCGQTVESLAKGKALLLAECQECHKIYSSTSFGPEQWQHILDEMAPKAKIDQIQKNLILDYILCDIRSKK